MHPEIPIQEPFKKSWSEPQVIVTSEDIINYENSQKQNCTQQRETINARRSELQSIASTWTGEQNDDCRESTEILQKRLMDLRNSLLQSQIVMQQLQTPNKQCDNTHDSCLVFRSDVSLTNSQDCDWINRMIPEHSISRSLPSSPLIGELPNMTSSPTIPSTPDRHFNFIPERLRLLEESRQLSESDELDNGFLLSQEYCNLPQGSNRCQNAHHRAALSPRRTVDSLHFEQEMQMTETPPLRAKRKLDMDDPYEYITSVKQAKSDVSHEAGLRYVNQLEMDLMSLKHRIQSAGPERFSRKSNCACAEIEKHFMELATSAYKSIRRYDGTIHSFEQFKEELTQTNKVIKDSMALLQNVRRLCVH